MFTLACGLSSTGIQLIESRAAAGLAIFFCLPSTVSTNINNIPLATIETSLVHPWVVLKLYGSLLGMS